MKFAVVPVAAQVLMLCSSAAIAVPVQIDDAPIEESASAPLVARVPQQGNKAMFDSSRQSRVYAISVLDYAHIKSTASPVMINNGLVRERSIAQQLNAEATYKPDQIWTIKGDVQAQFSTAYENATPLYERGAQDWLRLNEFFIEHYSASSWSVLAGKYRRVFSPGVFQNPMDRHNPVSALPGQPLQREGAYLAQVSYERNFNTSALSDTKLSVAFLPGILQDKNGIPTDSTNVIHFDETKPLNNSIVLLQQQWSPSRMGLLVRLYANLFSGDANFVSYYLDEQMQYGYSYARYFLPWLELHGESLVYQKPHYALITGEIAENKYVDYMLGTRLEFDQDQGVIIEYLHQAEQPDSFAQDAKGQRVLIARLLVPNSHRLFSTPLQNYLLMSIYKRNMRDTYSITANAIFGLAQKEAMATVRGDMKVGAQAAIALTAAYIAGVSSSFYGAAMPNDFRLTSEMQIVF